LSIITVQGQEVAVVKEFVYHHSIIHSATQSSPDISCHTILSLLWLCKT